MIRLLKFLITGDWHLHEWKVDEKVIVYDPMPSIHYHCQCKHCGKIKTFNKRS